MCFFVAKKSGQLRLIFDTRLLNQAFIDPPSTDLPSADSFTRLELPEDSQFFIGSGDLSNAFYTLQVPSKLGELFTLPTAQAGTLGISTINGCSIPPGTQVLPYLTVLPMGWSWALHLCQMVLMHGIHCAGIPDHCIIGDKRLPVHVDGPTSIAVAGYVDNFGVFGCSKEHVDSGLRKISKTLRDWGLTVHEEEEASLKADFIGMHFNGETGYLSIKPSRLIKIKAGIDDLLRRQFCSGRTLQLVLGHCTWAMMTRREGLSLLQHSYSFCHKHMDDSVRLWPSVRKELNWISSLLPLFRMKLNCSWGTDVMASDSSPWGVGICSRKLDVKTVQEFGRVSERWRYKFEDAAHARKHALGEAASTEAGNDDGGAKDSSGYGHSFSTFIINNGFNEVPESIMKREDWSVVWSRPWKFQANILNTEARGLAWSVEHLLRANRSINKRLLCFSDNLPLVLGCVKGRAKSGHLIKPLRKIAGLCLATGSRVSVRWVASELNVADEPSRAVSAWKALGWDRWWHDFEKEDHPRTKSHGFGRDLQWQSSKESASKIEGEGGDRCAANVDLLRNPKCEATNHQGLPETTAEVHRMDESDRSDCSQRGGTRLVLGGVHERDVREGGGNRHRREDSCRTSVLLPASRKTCFGNTTSKCEGPEGVDGGRTAAAATSAANRGAGRHLDGVDCQGQARARTEALCAVPDVSSPGGMLYFESEAVGASPARRRRTIPKLGHFAVPDGGCGPRQNWGVRRNSSDRLRPLDQRFPHRSHSQQAGQRQSVDRPSSSLGGRVPQGDRDARTTGIGKLPLHSSTWRSHTRHCHQASNNAGGETKGALGLRQFTEEVCEACSPSMRAVKDAGCLDRKRTRHSEAPPNSFKSGNVKCGEPVSMPKVTRRLQKKAAACSVEFAKSEAKQKSGRELLQHLFKQAVRNAKHRKRFVFLDLFSGDGGVGKYLRRQGYAVISIDVCNNPKFDLCDPEVQKLIFGWLRSRCIIGVWLATPCTTWSRARHGPVGSSWGPLRDNKHLFELPGLPPKDRDKVRVGNATASFTIEIIRLCTLCHVPCFLENPSSSMLWKLPKLVRLGGLSCSQKFITDFCQHGARWRKRTRIQAWHSPDVPSFHRQCIGHGGICCSTGKYHIVLRGLDPVSRLFWTHLAQP